MDEFKYCKRCGKLFYSTGEIVCRKCTDKEEEDYRLVKEYIGSHEEVNIVRLSEGTGVSVCSILRFLKEERLLMTIKEGGTGLVCESCGLPLTTGRYCSSCKEKLQGA